MPLRPLAVMIALVSLYPSFCAAEPYQLQLRHRSQQKSDYLVEVRRESWDPAKTAIVVCDMWDLHHCLNATRRVAEMAPRMNQLLNHARQQGSLIIHAPSSCMAGYAEHPARLRAKQAPRSKNLPKDIGQWCHRIEAEEKGVYPLDQSDGGEDDDLAEHAAWAKKLAAMGRNPRAPWKTQYDGLEIKNQDVISDNGEEIWNVLESRGIKNVILVGVHTNMCVLGRPFGLRQMAKNNKNVVLVRDMTDTMYNPARWPYVSHFQGTDLIVEHIEKFVCPTITSDQLIGGETFRFKNDIRRQVVFVIAESLYETDQTLPLFASRVVRDRLGMEVKVLQAAAQDKNLIPGLREALESADLVVLSARRRALPAADLEAFRSYLNEGNPLIALRTSSHAFDTKGKHPAGHAEWPEFDKQVLGGNYHGHHPSGPIASVSPAAKDHPLLTGVQLPLRSKGSLYQSSPLAKGAQMILEGKIDNQPPEPVAWTHSYRSGKVFYTSLGHKTDFEQAAFTRLMENAIRWTVGMHIRDR